MSAPHSVRWSEEEDRLIRDNPRMTAVELAELLPNRTWQAIKWRRAKKRLLVGDRSPYRADPFAVAGRKLVARTCSRCGVTRGGDAFGWRADKNCWRQECNYCLASRNRKLRVERGYSNVDRQREYQQATLPTADRRYFPWTGAEIEVLGDSTLSTVEKAILLRRTYSGTQCAISRYGFASRDDCLEDLRKDVWKIDNPNVRRLLEERQGQSSTRSGAVE